MSDEGARNVEQKTFGMETSMSGSAATALARSEAQSRRIVEPIFDASGTLRRVPADGAKPEGGNGRSTLHPARS